MNELCNISETTRIDNGHSRIWFTKISSDPAGTTGSYNQNSGANMQWHDDDNTKFSIKFWMGGGVQLRRTPTECTTFSTGDKVITYVVLWTIFLPYIHSFASVLLDHLCGVQQLGPASRPLPV